MKDKDTLIKELKSEISMLKAVLRKMPGNIYWKSIDDRLLGCNENNAKNFGYSSPEEMVGRYGADTLHPEDAERTRQVDLRVMQTGCETSFEELFEGSDGKPVIYLSRKSPFYDDTGNLIGILGISVDITHQKKTEEKLKVARKKAETASRAKSKFLAMINHELRIPLTSILGFIHFLQREGLGEEERKSYIQSLAQSGNYLLTLVNQVLEYSKLEANKTDITYVPLNFKKLIVDVIDMLKGMAIKKNLPLDLDYDSTLPEMLMVSPSILQQILINLIGNAIKFTQNGKIKVIVKCIERNEKSVKLDILVQDSGVGIPAKKLKTIFKEFYQVEDVYTRKNSVTGTGLGLTIVKKLIQQLGWKINVASKLNQGSTFTMTGSCLLPDKKLFDLHQVTIKPEMTQPALKKQRVLLVEDDALVQFVHKKMLVDIGCQVDVADCGKKALELLSTDYQIIFVDIGLPDINGFDLIREIKKIRPALTAPIIALTGFIADQEKKRCLSAGAVAVLMKPIPKSALLDVLKQYAGYEQ